jgi:hypothetical protein
VGLTTPTIQTGMLQNVTWTWTNLWNNLSNDKFTQKFGLDMSVYVRYYENRIKCKKIGRI